MLKKTLLSLLCVFALSGAATTANAQANIERYTDVSIISNTSHARAGETIELATIITLAPEWHVYWVNPGDSGLPVDITWSAPEGSVISAIQWPLPDKIIFDILANYGYYDRVTLIQSLTLPQELPEGKIDIAAQVNMLVCKDICIPENASISLTLNNPAQEKTSQNTVFATAKAMMPKELGGDFKFHEEDGHLVLEIRTANTDILNAAQNNALEFFPHEYGLIAYVEKPQITVSGDILTLRHKRGDLPMHELANLSGVLVLQDGLKTISGFSVDAVRNTEKPLNPAPDSAYTATTAQDIQTIPATQSQKSQIGVLGALVFAFLGGLILNLMPCVFPVLSMKALSLVKMKGKEAAMARQYGLAYTCGVILSFLAIGGIFLALKATGSSIGWGFQLQNPVVVAVLAYMLFLIGLNLVGLFEITGRFGNVGQRLTSGQGISNSFFTGILATIVATPCTAPFMGAAMGFAIVQPAVISLAIFFMLGLGLAFPYLLLSFIPAAQKILPRPGAWMDTFKQFLAFPMFASAIWLIWVLDQQTGSFGILLVLLGMLCIAFCIWLVRHQPTGMLRLVNHTLFFICLAIPVFSLGYLKAVPMPANHTSTYGDEKPFGETFSRAGLDEALNGDQAIFVEMTAAWCITCKFNHAVALNITSTKNLFAEKNIRYFIGDWTNYDEEITAYLETYGRNGVPIYVFYGAPDAQTGKRPEPVLLPQVLTPAIVQDVVSK